MNDVEKITDLLGSESLEKQIAAAIVLGELKPKGPHVVDGLTKAVGSGIGPLQRHALEALARIGAKKALPVIFPLLSTRDDELRRAAVRAVASVGEEVVPTIRARLPEATPEEKRALDAILADLGGKDAFTTLLAGLTSSDAEAARAAAIAMREHVKQADGRQRRSYLSELEKFLAKMEKNKDKDVDTTAAIAAALKILGYLEDERATETLLSYATAAKRPALVRQEALIALRFALGTKAHTPKVIAALVDAAEDTDRALANTALHTLGGLELPQEAARRLEKLASHPDLDRARFVMEQLARQGGAEGAKVLVKVLTTTKDRRRAEVAAQLLGGREEAVPALAKALVETQDADRSWAIRNVLRPLAKRISPAMRKQLVELAMERLADSERNWEAALDVARDADPDGVAVALRELAGKLRKKNADKALTVLRILTKSDRATDEDRYQQVVLELARHRLDTNPAARHGDETLRMIAALAGRGFDVSAPLRKERSLELDALYYVGFHFIEKDHPLGEDLLTHVVEKGGRTKIGKMAKNKLALAERA